MFVLLKIASVRIAVKAGSRCYLGLYFRLIKRPSVRIGIMAEISVLSRIICSSYKRGPAVRIGIMTRSQCSRIIRSSYEEAFCCSYRHQGETSVLSLVMSSSFKKETK